MDKSMWLSFLAHPVYIIDNTTYLTAVYMTAGCYRADQMASSLQKSLWVQGPVLTWGYTHQF